MLTHLRIQDLVVVESATLELDAGLNVLSGSTGAGKSVLLAAIAMVTGARARSDWIRPGADRACVEAFFRLEPDLAARAAALGIETDEGQLHLRRVIRPDGRGQAWLDGFPVTVRRLRELGALLVERQDQHAQLRLVEAAEQLALLDDYAGNAERLDAYRRRHAEVARGHRELESLRARLAAARRDEDYLRFQLEELDALAPAPGEREELEQEERRLRNAARLQELFREAIGLLEGEPGALTDGLAALTRLLERAARLGEEIPDPGLQAWGESLVDLGRELAERAQALELAAREGEALAARLGQLGALERKHGRPLPELIEWADEQRALLAQLDRQDEALAERSAELADAEAELSASAAILHAARREAAAELGRAWQERLGRLGMERATLRVAVEALADPEGWVTLDGKRYRASEQGIDRVELRVRTNPDLPEGGLGEVPSGGELSRIAFARQLLPLPAGLGPPVIVLDEVDAGIGADLAATLATQLRELGGRRQVLAVTHQASIAAAANRQFRVVKEFADERTRSEVRLLGEDERLEELARMLGESGDGTESRALAASLLADAAGGGA